MSKFNRIAIVGRPGHTGVAETCARLLKFLSDQNVTVIMDSTTAKLAASPGYELVDREMLSANCDLVIVVGGDGSMLKMAKFVVPDDVPVIGINRGKLGFLTDVLPDELEEQLSAVLAGDYTVEERFLLDVSYIKNGQRHALASALNDVVLHPGQAAQMIEFELFVEDRFVYSQESDGLIAATPTGSTAYALSAGGPIMHPDLNAIVLVPMYPHSLSSRPIVVDGQSEIKLVVARRALYRPLLSCDGEVCHTAQAGEAIVITKKRSPLLLIHPLNHTFYQACRSKLGWGSRLANSDD
ncbi:MAG: NAD(+) kinase [Gammaproteobacteria bacterium]|nr:NAD(+) kinase [Gammaproteobacteria bacterium]